MILNKILNDGIKNINKKIDEKISSKDSKWNKVQIIYFFLKQILIFFRLVQGKFNLSV